MKKYRISFALAGTSIDCGELTKDANGKILKLTVTRLPFMPDTGEELVRSPQWDGKFTVTPA